MLCTSVPTKMENEIDSREFDGFRRKTNTTNGKSLHGVIHTTDLPSARILFEILRECAGAQSGKNLRYAVPLFTAHNTIYNTRVASRSCEQPKNRK